MISPCRRHWMGGECRHLPPIWIGNPRSRVLEAAKVLWYRWMAVTGSYSSVLKHVSPTRQQSDRRISQTESATEQA